MSNSIPTQLIGSCHDIPGIISEGQRRRTQQPFTADDYAARVPTGGTDKQQAAFQALSNLKSAAPAKPQTLMTELEVRTPKSNDLLDSKRACSAISLCLLGDAADAESDEYFYSEDGPERGICYNFGPGCSSAGRNAQS
jgi:hypothetical protein